MKNAVIFQRKNFTEIENFINENYKFLIKTLKNESSYQDHKDTFFNKNDKKRKLDESNELPSKKPRITFDKNEGVVNLYNIHLQNKGLNLAIDETDPVLIDKISQSIALTIETYNLSLTDKNKF